MGRIVREPLSAAWILLWVGFPEAPSQVLAAVHCHEVRFWGSHQLMLLVLGRQYAEQFLSL